MRVLIHLLFLTVLIFAGDAKASSGWTVDRAGGDVFFAPDGKTWSEVATGQEIPNASWIQTGRRGRVILRRNEERILIHPGSLTAIATWQNEGSNTKVVHRKGSVVLDLEVRDRRHAEVETPHMAAVVKGTVFEVSVNRKGSSVRVDRGQVNVRNSGSSRETSITPGQMAMVSASGEAAVTVVAAPQPAETIASVSEELDPAKSKKSSRASSRRSAAASGNGGSNDSDGPEIVAAAAASVAATGSGSGSDSEAGNSKKKKKKKKKNRNKNNGNTGNGSSGGGNDDGDGDSGNTGNGNNGNGSGNGGSNSDDDDDDSGNNGNGNNGNNGNGKGNNGNGNGNGGSNNDDDDDDDDDDDSGKGKDKGKDKGKNGHGHKHGHGKGKGKGKDKGKDD